MRQIDFNFIGCWIVRIVLVIGAVVAACLDKPEVATMLGVVTVMSFIFLDPD